jgi:hypothetical protein
MSHRLAQPAIVIGPGICGLSASEVLPPHFDDIVVLASMLRDRHPHGLLAGGFVPEDSDRALYVAALRDWLDIADFITPARREPIRPPSWHHPAYSTTPYFLYKISLVADAT